MADTTFITGTLDRLEAALPTVPARVVRLQRTVAATMCDRSSIVVERVADATRNIVDTARLSGKVVTGQARAAGSDLVTTTSAGARQVAGQAKTAGNQVAKSARTGARTVSGQVDAQGEKLAATATDEVTGLLDAATSAVDGSPGSGTPYEQWTKAELLERAREIDLDGRSGLSKSQLIAALRAN